MKHVFIVRRPFALALVAAGVLLVSPLGAQRPAPQAQAPVPVQDSTRAQVIDHVIPARDSQGKSPTLFRWTAARGADSYSIGVWTEVDQLIWRQNNIPTTEVNTPPDVRFEPGTYFWTVSALREGQQIGESGLAAFVVRDPQQ